LWSVTRARLRHVVLDSLRFLPELLLCAGIVLLLVLWQAYEGLRLRFGGELTPSQASAFAFWMFIAVTAVQEVLVLVLTPALAADVQHLRPAQVADPRDLVVPQGETPADTLMRTRAVENLRKGEDPGTNWKLVDSSLSTVGAY